MKATLLAVIGFTLLAFTGDSGAQTPSTNVEVTIPEINFQDVPITTVIANLARQEELNYLIDPYACQNLTGSTEDNIPEPTVNFRLQNVSARTALTRMLTLRGFILKDNPVTGITRITRTNEPVNIIDIKLLGMDANNPVPATNDILPLIVFSDVPIEAGLENLFKICDLSAELDPSLRDYSDRKNPPPILNLRWQRVTAKQAIIALCENYDLAISKDAATGILHVHPQDGKRRHSSHRQ